VFERPFFSRGIETVPKVDTARQNSNYCPWLRIHNTSRTHSLIEL